ncbi:hypothetical protein ACHAXS_009406 [Conticribra weissflogii]
MIQLDVYPCLFISDRLDDRQHIYNLAEKLLAEDMLLEEEVNTAEFLGVKHVCLKDCQISMMQCSLIDFIASALVLDSYWIKMKSSQAAQKLLVKDTNGALYMESFNYCTVVGMPLYLAGHSKPDNSYPIKYVLDTLSVLTDLIKWRWIR